MTEPEPEDPPYHGLRIGEFFSIVGERLAFVRAQVPSLHRDTAIRASLPVKMRP